VIYHGLLQTWLQASERYRNNLIIQLRCPFDIANDNAKSTILFTNKIAQATQLPALDMLSVFNLNRQQTKFTLQ